MRRLMSNGTEKLVGNKGFWASDYMVSMTTSKLPIHHPLPSRQGFLPLNSY